MIKQPFCKIISVMIVTFFISCGGGGSGNYEVEEASDTVLPAASVSEEDSEESPFTGKTIVGAIHEVSDFDAWQEVYLEKSDPKSRVGYIQSVSDPNLIAVFEFTPSHEDAKARFNDPEFQKIMDSAGVKSKPSLTFYDIKYLNDVENSKPFRVAINHEVKDFAIWKEGFDKDADNRSEVGLILLGLATASNDPNFVYLMFAIDDVGVVKEMLASPMMKLTMKDAGVIGKPNVSYWKVPKNIQDGRSE